MRLTQRPDDPVVIITTAPTSYWEKGFCPGRQLLLSSYFSLLKILLCFTCA